jgi:hypothetical protein
MNKPYVIHFCKNKQCDSGWLAPDEYGVRSLPPRHLYCDDCELFEGKTNKKDPKRVAAGKVLAAKRKALNKALEGLW